MDLGGILSIAASGIAVESNALAVISRNVSNAGTSGYVHESATQISLTADGVVSGVRVGATRRDVDSALQASSFTQNAMVAGLQTTDAALSGIVAVQGTTGSGQDLASLVGALQDSFTALSNDPSNQAQQSAVVIAAGTLTRQINVTAQAVGEARQTAQDDAVSAVGNANASLTSIGTLSRKIVGLQATGQSTADLESQRDTALDALNKILPVTVVRQTNGDVGVYTSSGVALPTQGGPTLSLGVAALGTDASAMATAPRLTVGSTDITASVTGGQLGADLTLRDTTLPAYQAGLDEFAHTLSARFDAQGVTLFTDGSGQSPPGGGTPVQSGYLGYSSTIQVNPMAQATPAAIVSGLSGSTVTAPSGRAGDATVVDQALNAFTTQQSPGVAQPAPATSGLGAGGTISLPYAAPATLGDFASALVGSMVSDSSKVSGQLTTETAMQGTLNTKLSNSQGVSIDTEMSQMIEIQNAYAANGKVVGAVQAMWTSLLAMVPA